MCVKSFRGLSALVCTSMFFISVAFVSKSFCNQACDPDSQPSASYEEPATQLDPEVSVATQLDPEPEHEVDSVKKRKSEHPSGLEPDRLKWVGDLCFVQRGIDGLIYCGRDKMYVSSSKLGLECLTCKCARGKLADCRCTCHALKEHYEAKYTVHRK